MHVVALQGAAVYGYRSGIQEELVQMRSSVTVGSFDGVHVGHRKIIAAMVAHARSKALCSVIVTFEPHPRLVLDRSRECPVRLLSSLEEKIDNLESLGIDLLVVVRFDREFSARSSESFIRDVLVKLLGAEHVVVGYDHGFGRDRSGGGDTLAALGVECGFTLEVIGKVSAGTEHVSSTRIRELLETGRIREANECLGAPYMVSGTVMGGEKIGREIGFPTVNLELPERCKQLPACGVYITRTEFDGHELRAMMNIGRRPTVSREGRLSIEAHILGYSGDLYGRFLKFRLLDYLREEKRFASLTELREQLEADKKRVELYEE
jgi:riboflavin kinase / FMN adenylyltransferase